MIELIDEELSNLFGLCTINDRVETSRDDDKQDTREFGVVFVLRETVHDDNDATAKNNDQEDQEVSAAGLQGLTAQRLVLTGQADHKNPTVGDDHAADGGGRQNHGEGQAVDVIYEDTLTGQFEE